MSDKEKSAYIAMGFLLHNDKCFVHNYEFTDSELHFVGGDFEPGPRLKEALQTVFEELKKRTEETAKRWEEG